MTAAPHASPSDSTGFTGRLVAIQKVSSVEYLDRVFDCYADGSVAVPIDADGVAPEGYSFAERRAPAAGGGWFSRAQAPIHSDAPAQISFSSGTTGAPKAILLSHRALADVTDRLVAAMGVDSSIREYLGVPATYSFGLGRARVVAAVGGQLYVPPNGFDPNELARMLDAGEINALSAVPTLLRVLVQNPELIGRKTGRRLQWLEIGSQPMSAEDKHAVRRMFPAARIVQHYGLTEASRTTFLDLQEATDAQLDSVGKPTGAAEVRVDGDGHICIRGPHVADGMLTAQGLQPVADAEGWLRTNDLGRLDDEGFVHFLGRADYLLNIGGIKVPAELFEERLADKIGSDAANVAVGSRADALRGEVVMVAHLAGVPAATLLAAARETGAGFGLGAADVILVEVAAIPRTATGKIQRAELGSQAATVPAESPAAAADPAKVAAADGEFHNDREREIAAIWRDALGIPTIGRNDTFFDMGGDSLSAITAMLRMERAGVPKSLTQQIFEGRTIAEIAGNEISGETTPAERPRASPRAMASDAITMTRAILVLHVLLSHWGPFVLLRAGHLGQVLLEYSSPVIRAGTPGFAFIYGAGLSFFGAAMVKDHRDRLRSNAWRNVLLLGGGVVVTGLARGTHLLVEGNMPTPTLVIYGVLFAYLLLVAISVPLLRFVMSRHNPVLTCLMMGAICLLIFEYSVRAWGDSQTDGWLNLARLMMVAKYSLPQMLGFSVLGMAVGLWFDRDFASERLPGTVFLAGVTLVLASILFTVSTDTEALWFGRAGAEMLLGYFGSALLLFAVLLKAVRCGVMTGALRFPFRILLMIGVLAFLVYVGQELGTELSRTLLALNVPGLIAWGAAPALLALLMIFAIRRFYRLYYG